ncbi:glycoside hydrolase family 99-like domain-containing protein [Lysobacter rhizosphaerae]
MHAGGRALGYVERSVEPLPDPLAATLVAFYLPQFHAIPENDAWWGQGFTEWRSVARALPQFEGHAQPRLPGDLGFYDLCNPQVMRDQARLAREYGIGAFCFYFYWFGGNTLLESPLQQWLEDESIDLPFCLCWANENWSRRWDGRAEDILIAQAHSTEDDLAFIAHVARYMRDPRYLRVDGKPLLLVYRPGLLPDATATAQRWRTWCRDNGVGDIFIAYVQGFERPDPRDIGFDAAVEFPPNLSTPPQLTAQQYLINSNYSGQVLDWRVVANDYCERNTPQYLLFPGVNCGWDNEPRRAGQGRTYLHASPQAYCDWLRHAATHRLQAMAPAQRLVFINAWNEWAEGAVLEPDARLGHAWLHATRQALQTSASSTTRPCVVIHAWYPETFDEILATLTASGIQHRLVVTTSPERFAQIKAVLERRGLPAEIEVTENRGRDILPFLRVAYRLRREGETVLLKLHTKHSPHRSDGDHWRAELLERLLPPARSDRIAAALADGAGPGLVYPDGHLQPLGFYWGANEANVRYVARRCGIASPRVETDIFVSGSMFWVRMDALAPLLDAHFDECEFEAEAGQLDGTFAHAIERVFALSARAQGRDVVAASTVSGASSPTTSRDYPYARRG